MFVRNSCHVLTCLTYNNHTLQNAFDELDSQAGKRLSLLNSLCRRSLMGRRGLRMIVRGIARTARGLSPFVINARLATSIIQPKMPTGMAAVAVTVSTVLSIVKRTPLRLPSRSAVKGSYLTLQANTASSAARSKHNFVLLVKIV